MAHNDVVKFLSSGLTGFGEKLFSPGDMGVIVAIHGKNAVVKITDGIVSLPASALLPTGGRDPKAALPDAAFIRRAVLR